MATSSTELPVISLSWDAATLAARLLTAANVSGFFYLVDHGIPEQDIARAFAISKDFFDNAPMEERKKHPFDTKSGVGYTGIRQETLDATLTRGDLKESFYLGPLNQMQQSLPYPFIDPENRAFLETLQDKLHKASHRVLSGLAEALNLKPEIFKSCHSAAENRMRFIHYPAVDGPTDEQDIRASTHSDYGSITLLMCEGQPGLQVKGTDGSWKDAQHLPGALVVNIGDALEFWSGGALRSTLHRVIMPKDENKSVARRSIAYFVEADFDTALEVMSGSYTMSDTEFNARVASKGIDPGVRRMTNGQFLKARLAATYA